jgi:signal transduction histidine kinase
LDGAPFLTQPRFRTRVLIYLALFAMVPTSVLLLGGAAGVSSVLPVLSGKRPWEVVEASGRKVLESMRGAPLTAAQRAALDEHERVLGNSLIEARRYEYLASRVAGAIVILAIAGSLILSLLAWRAAGHLSRQLSRPLSELVEWTELVARGQPLPAGKPQRGAPEFEVMRRRMREMADQIIAARAREIEAERLEAFRETARRVAHELKNPLTPISLAIARLRRDADPSLTEIVDVLETETKRIDAMARSFAQFGRLPEGPAAAIDVAELANEAARSLSGGAVPVTVQADENVPQITGHYEALSRALSNVLLNAVEACRAGGSVRVHVARSVLDGRQAVELRVVDTGKGIAPERLAAIWEPYHTTTAGGTGLGLAIARQTVLAHGGAVSATSDKENGTEIRFILPVSSAPADHKPEGERST